MRARALIATHGPSGVPPFPLDLAGVLAPLRRGRGDPTWRSAGEGAAVWRVVDHPGRAGHRPPAPPRRRHGGGRGVGARGAVVARRAPGAAGRRRRPGGLRGPPPDRRRRRPPAARSPVRCHRAGVGLAGPRRAGAEGHGHRGAALVARAVPPLRRPRAGAGRPGRRHAGAADPRTGPGHPRLGVAPGGRGLRQATGDPRVRRGGTPPGGRVRARRGGRPHPPAEGARYRRLDRRGGGAAGLGRSRRRQLR